MGFNNNYKSTVANTFLSIFFSLVLLVIYSELSQYWVNFGGLSGNLIKIELPILCGLIFLLAYPSNRVGLNITLTALPIVGTYFLYDVFYHFLARSPRISDLTGFTNLADFSITLSSSLIFVIAILVFLIVLNVYQFSVTHSKVTVVSVLSLKTITLLCLVYFTNTAPFQAYFDKGFDYVVWSQEKTIHKNGRFSSSMYYNASSRKAREKLKQFKDQTIEVNSVIFGDSPIKNKRNVYIAMLESFVDPRLIQDTSFSRSPLAEDLLHYLEEEQFSMTKSPVYGGGTPQAEFEVLTGSKALAKIDSMEFNTLGGMQTSGLVNALKGIGYSATATIATNSGYYNSKIAYQSLGFDRTLFLEEDLDQAIKDEGDKHIFDGDLFTYNIEQLEKTKHEKPYIHYTLGMYGHFPYGRNKALRPDVLSCEHDDKRLERIANQFFYRTQAIATYIKSIMSIDRTAIIFISSDHLPPLLTNGVRYQRDKHDNISLLLDAGKPVNIDGKSFFEIPRIIWSILSEDKQPLSEIDDHTYEDIYFKVLSDSL